MSGNDAGAVAGLEAVPFKASRVAGYAAAVERIQSRGVSVNGCFILGADHHGIESFAKIARFADEVGLVRQYLAIESIRLGDRVTVMPGCFIGAEVVIGADTLIYPNVTIRERCTVGDRCIIHSGAVIGSDGFGFEPTPGGWKKIPQVGTVLVEDEVEIGGEPPEPVRDDRQAADDEVAHVRVAHGHRELGSRDQALEQRASSDRIDEAIARELLWVREALG